ncbi:unnamed protein product [Auanema sp. JU1783]|nr:unnamed protein product [Auanema sp. JU1783]
MVDEKLNHLYMPSNFTGEDGKQVLANFIVKEEKLYKDFFSQHLTNEIRYGQDEAQVVDIYGKVEKKLFLSIHGGYWMEGSRQYGISPVVPFFEKGWAVGSVGYKLAIDGYGLKSTIEDAIQAVQKVLEVYPGLTDIVIGGHSAGGYLCWKVAAALKSAKIRGVIALAPIFKIKELTETEVGLAIGLKKDDFIQLDCRVDEWNGLNIAALFMVGTNESPPFKEQLMDMVQELQSRNQEVRSKHKIFDGSNHFSLVWNIALKDSAENKTIRDFIDSL